LYSSLCFSIFICVPTDNVHLLVEKDEKLLMLVVHVDEFGDLKQQELTDVVTDASNCLLSPGSRVLLSVVFSGTPNLDAPQTLHLSGLHPGAITLAGLDPQDCVEILQADGPPKLKDALARHGSLAEPLAACAGGVPRLLRLLVENARERAEVPDSFAAGELLELSKIVKRTVSSVKHVYPSEVWTRLFPVSHTKAVATLLSWALEGRVVEGSDRINGITVDQARAYGVVNIVQADARSRYRVIIPPVLLRAIVQELHFEIDDTLLDPFEVHDWGDFERRMMGVRLLKNQLYLAAGVNAVSLSQIFPGALGHPHTLARKVGRQFSAVCRAFVSLLKSHYVFPAFSSAHASSSHDRWRFSRYIL
jgi:hypothetical protein